MEIILGKYAGFCHGVSRAVGTVRAQMNGKSLCTYGELINNGLVTGELARNGVRMIHEISQAKEGETVVIRSHGAAWEAYGELDARGTPYIDCTCPDVKKIHRLAEKSVEDGKRVIIVGNENHPEVIAAKSYAGADFIIIDSPEAAERAELPPDEKYALVVQTTFVHDVFLEIVETLRARRLELDVYDTVCASMINRQKEAGEISREADVMLVIGDRSSSNTTKLYEICKHNCQKTYLIETISDLQLNILHVSGKIGIVAGASTPPEIIKEAFLIMSEAVNGANQTFEEMLDESFITLHTGDVVKGTVIQVANGEVSVNLGFKSDGLIPRSEYSDDPNIDPADHLQPGDDIEVFVVRVNDGEGNVLLSKKKIDAKRNFDEIETAFTEKTPVVGKVAEVVKGGLILNVKGVRVFVPSSQVSNRYVEDLNQFKGKDMSIEIIEFDKSKRRIVGGRKALAAREQEENREKVFGNIEVGQEVEGTVSRIVNFGAFVDLGGVDGLIHISELSWGRVKKVSDVLKEGDAVTVRVLDIDKEKGRISLSLKDVTSDPWDSVAEKYRIGEIIEGKVVRMAAFGAFIELEEGVDGLVHISQISANHVVKPEDELSIGQIIQVKVMDIDRENNRISLSKKEVDGISGESAEDYEAEAPLDVAGAEEAGVEDAESVPEEEDAGGPADEKTEDETVAEAESV